MKLTRIFATNYKGFKELDLKIRPFNLVIGKNGSGKSTLSRLIPFIMESITSDEEQVNFSPLNIDLGEQFSDIAYQGVETKIITTGAEFTCEEGTRFKVSTSFAYYNKEKLTLIQSFEFHVNDEVKISLNLDGEAPSQKLYLVNGISMHVSFNAAIPDPSCLKEVDDKGYFTRFTSHLEKFKKVTNYLGPFRAKAKRVYPHSLTSYSSVGEDGTYAPFVLYNDMKHTGELCKNVKDWMIRYFNNRYIEPKIGDLGFSLHLKTDEFSNNIVDDGVGFSQFYPLIVSRFLWDKRKSIEVVEQPEIHLHPGVSSSVIELYFDGISDDKVYFLETHSKEVALRLRRKLIGSSAEKVDNVQIIYTSKENNSCKIDYIYIDENLVK